MSFENTKKKILTIKIISCIIINILRLKELHTKISSSNLINKFGLLKDLSKITYNLLTFNLISLAYNTIPLYMKIKKSFKLFKKSSE